MKRDLRRIGSMASALVLAVGMAASPLGLASAQADGGLTISGNVIGAASNLGGISVSGCTTDWSFCSDTFVTDASGNFALTGLQSGAYILDFQAGPGYQWGWYVGPGLTQIFGSATPVSAGSVLTDVQLEAAYSISGEVTGAAGGLANLQVAACADNSGCETAAVDDAGNYSITGLSPDTYNLHIYAPPPGIGPVGLNPNSPYVFGWYDGSGVTPKSAKALPITVGGSNVTLPVFDVPVGAVLSGGVTGSAGNLGNLFVELCFLGDGGCYDTTTNDNGSFHVSGLWAGKYRLEIDDFNHTYVSGYYTPSGLVWNDYSWTPIQVGARDVTLPTLGLETASTIQGTVTGNAGALGGVMVEACSTTGQCSQTRADDAGNFTVTGLAQGLYTINFDDWYYNYATGYYSDSGVAVPTVGQATQVAVPPSVTDLTVALTSRTSGFAPNPPTNVIATAGDGSATVSWTPSYDGGSPISSYTVTASDGSTCVSTTTTCNVTGLVNGNAVTFFVTATNAIGTSGWSDTSAPVTPVGPAGNGPARLVISATSHTSVAGATFSVTVSALKKNGTVDTGYSRTVNVVTTDIRSGGGEVYTFTPADAGTHTFTVSLMTAGAQSVQAFDGPLATRNWAMTVKPGPTASLFVTGPQTATAGVAGRYTVTAIDVFGNTAIDDASPLSITSSDPSMSTSPVSVALVHGKHAFSATFKTAGAQSIQVAETGNPTLSRTIGGISVSPAKAASISLTGLANPATAGVATTVTATARDRFGNVATGYLGTVHFISNDKSAALPSDYTFTAADAGVHTFNITLNTKGNRWITIRDASKHSIGGRALTTVVANP
jgi:hypothetical protein